MSALTENQRNEIKKRFSSGNDVSVERAHLSRDEGLSLLADAERLAELERIAETDSAEDFLRFDNNTKLLMFANHVRESERRKQAEDRLAEVEVALQEEIDGLRASAYDVRDDGYFEWSRRCLRVQADRLQRILAGDEGYA